MKHHWLLVPLCIIILSVLCLAEPAGPLGLSVITSERGNISAASAAQVEAQAGNVSQLSINYSKITDAWQGYYGNVTGVIVLDNANNWTMYSWTLTSASGEVYAANETVSNWGGVLCLNFSANGTLGDNTLGAGINVTQLEVMYGMTGQSDGMDETFQGTNDLVVGSNSLTSCPATNTYSNDAAQSTLFNETILTINETSTVIFATQLEQGGALGYDNKNWDFQLIVGENGDVSGTTTYYFYVEVI